MGLTPKNRTEIYFEESPTPSQGWVSGATSRKLPESVASVAKFLGVNMSGVAKCLVCKMSGCQNVLIRIQWLNVWVAQCLGGKMSC